MATSIRNDSNSRTRRDERTDLLDLFSASAGTNQHLAKNDVLFQEGAELRHLYLVLGGSFKLVTHSSEGKELIVDLVERGDVLGTIAEHGESTSLARALEDSHVLALAASAVRLEIERSPALALALLRRAETKRREAEVQAARLAFQSVTGRLSSFLLEIADRRTGRLRFPLSQGEIANRIGSSRETVCSLLNELRRSGLIEIGRAQIRVVDWNGLAHVG